MKSFCVAASFAATLAAAIVFLAVALWNEGCNRNVVPQQVRFTENIQSKEFRETKGDAILIPGQGPNDRILIIPSY